MNRITYLLAHILLGVLAFLVFTRVAPGPLFSAFQLLFFILSITLIIWRGINIGWRNWAWLILLIPVVNVGFLLFAPSKERFPKRNFIEITPDRSTTVDDVRLVRWNLARNSVRTILLSVSILIAFLLFGVLVSFNVAITDVRTAPNRMVTLSKINFTESLPIAYFDRVLHTDGVLAATHMNWFGGYYQDQRRGFMAVFAVDPDSYLRVYQDDLHLTPQARETFLHERTALLVPRNIADRYHWRVGQHIPINSNIFTNGTNGSHVWDFTIAGIFETPDGNSQANSVLIRYDYFNDTITFGRDRIGWISFLTTSATVNDRVAHAIDTRFANSQDETSTQDAAAFNRSFAAQLGNIALVVTLVVGAAFAAILLIVGTTMALAVRERTKEVGVLKTLGFSSGRILRMVLGESMLLSLIGATLGLLAAAGVLYILSHLNGGGGGGFHLYPSVIGISAAIAIALGLVTGILPALSAYRMNIIEALGRR
ncbi:MAG: ABC transporter permease [Proteobacteria bacterium]|nr:ABC transporter permease [Pseudomonadota bacterium]